MTPSSSPSQPAPVENALTRALVPASPSRRRLVLLTILLAAWIILLLLLYFFSVMPVREKHPATSVPSVPSVLSTIAATVLPD